MNSKRNSSWKNWLLSVVIFLFAAKIVDIGFWNREKNDDHDLPLVEGKTWREYMAFQCQKDGIDWATIQKELLDVHYEKVEFHPYRWFVPAPNYVGEYIQTDNRGFRRSREFAKDKGTYKIGFFGGSTAFSLYSKPHSTLPALFDSALADSISVINFGVGAYSTTAELMCLAEVLRETNLDQAVFYDGVNEIGRYLESNQNPRFDYLSDQMGFPYVDIDIPVKKTFGLKSGFEKDEHWYGYVLKTIYPSILRYVIRTRSVNDYGSSKKTLTDANNILAIYEHNKKQIKALCLAYNVEPVFVWQPHLFNTNKKLSEEEMAIKQFQHTSQVEGISMELDMKIMEDPDVIMLTTVFDTLPEVSIFYDWHHLNDYGRKVVANALVEALVIPPDHMP